MSIRSGLLNSYAWLMRPRRFTVSISEECEATTPEHAVREIAYKLMRWDDEKYGKLKFTVTDGETGEAVVLTKEEFVPRYVWNDTGESGIS